MHYAQQNRWKKPKIHCNYTCDLVVDVAVCSKHTNMLTHALCTTKQVEKPRRRTYGSVVDVVVSGDHSQVEWSHIHVILHTDTLQTQHFFQQLVTTLLYHTYTKLHLCTTLYCTMVLTLLYHLL